MAGTASYVAPYAAQVAWLCLPLVSSAQTQSVRRLAGIVMKRAARLNQPYVTAMLQAVNVLGRHLWSAYTPPSVGDEPAPTAVQPDVLSQSNTRTPVRRARALPPASSLQIAAETWLAVITDPQIVSLYTRFRPQGQPESPVSQELAGQSSFGNSSIARKNVNGSRSSPVSERYSPVSSALPSSSASTLPCVVPFADMILDIYLFDSALINLLGRLVACDAAAGCAVSTKEIKKQISIWG